MDFKFLRIWPGLGFSLVAGLTVHGVAGAADFSFSNLSPFGDAFGDSLNWFALSVPGSGDDIRFVNLVAITSHGTVNYDRPPGIRYGGVLFIHDYEFRGGRLAGEKIEAIGQGPAGVRLLSGIFTRDAPSRIEARRGGYLRVSGLSLAADVVLSAIFDDSRPDDPPPRGPDSVIEVLEIVSGTGAVTVRGYGRGELQLSEYVCFVREAKHLHGPAAPFRDAARFQEFRTRNHGGRDDHRQGRQPVGRGQLGPVDRGVPDGQRGGAHLSGRCLHEHRSLH